MMSWRPFCTFSPGHSHGRNFTLIFFKNADEVESCLLLFAIEKQLDWLVISAKTADDVESCLPLFTIENQRDRFVTFANMADRVFEKKNPKYRQN